MLSYYDGVVLRPLKPVKSRSIKFSSLSALTREHYDKMSTFIKS